MTKTIKELMNQYVAYRAQWISFFGNDEGFDDWFTKQVVKGS